MQPDTRKILHCFSSFDPGGQELRFVRLANVFKGEAEHSLLAMDGRFGAAKGLDTDARVSMLTPRIKKGAGVPNLRMFRTLIKELNPDLICSYNFGAFEVLFSNLGLGIPHVHVEEGFGLDESVQRKPRRNWTRRIGFTVSKAKLIVVSETMRNIALDEWHLDASRCLVIPNGVQTAKYAKRLNRQGPSSLAQSPGALVVGTAARLRDEKNLPLLLTTFAAVSRLLPPGAIELVIAGDGPCRSELEAQANNLGIRNNVTFLGHRTDLDSLMCQFDVFALSSKTEQMPVGIIEAMASGLPIVSTDVGDVKNMVSSPNRPFALNDTPEKYAGSFLELCKNSPLRIELGHANAQKAMQTFEESQMIEAWRKVYLAPKHH